MLCPNHVGLDFFIYNIYTDVVFQRLAFDGYKPGRHNNNICNKLQPTPWANGITEFRAFDLYGRGKLFNRVNFITN